MKKFLIGLFCAIAFTSCVDSAVSNGREIYQMYYKKFLKDPNSFVVYSEKYQKDGEFAINWTIDYGAKNGYGAMTRKTENFKTIGKTIFIDGTHYTMSDLQ